MKLHHVLGIGLTLATLAAPLSASAQPFHMEDSLRGGTMGNPSGGSFGPDGWTVTSYGDRIWWALPRLASGYVEFTVENITLAVLPLGDHEIFAMYEDGYGLGEPINYNPEFRQNHYKVLMRITYVGAAFLAVVAVAPTIVSASATIDPNLASFYGGTSLLIAVSVAVDLVQKIDSHLVMRNYKGLTE